MRSTLFRYSILLLLGLAFIINACGFDTPGDPPVTPDTTIPSTLKVTVTITEDQEASDVKSVVTLSFSTNEIKEDNTVIFTHGESVNCNGITIDLGSAVSYSVRMNIPPVYTCDYHLNNNKPALIFSVPKRSRLSPVLHEPVGDNPNFKVTYNPDKNASDCQVKVDAIAGTSTISGDTVPENGNIYTGPDVRALSGSGNIMMTRTCVPPQYNYDHQNKANDGCQCNGPPPSTFDKINLTYTSTATYEVTWTPPNTSTITTS